MTTTIRTACAVTAAFTQWRDVQPGDLVVASNALKQVGFKGMRLLGGTKEVVEVTFDGEPGWWQFPPDDWTAVQRYVETQC